MIRDTTRSLIETRLAGLAAANHVDVLFACESGSRAWGFPSPDSDYDVRFIYAHPLPWYVAVEEGRDVIETPLEETAEGLFDLGGWDLRKTLRLARKSNPVIWEWLQSPIFYKAWADDAAQEIRQILDPFYSPVAACHHYIGLCRGTMGRVMAGDSLGIKKYFYMLRPILAALWIERYRTIPPMEFQLLLDILDGQSDLLKSISDLQERKRHMDERVPIQRIPLIDRFLGQELDRLAEAAPRLPAASGEISSLDKFLRKRLGIEGVA